MPPFFQLKALRSILLPGSASLYLCWLANDACIKGFFYLTAALHSATLCALQGADSCLQLLPLFCILCLTLLTFPEGKRTWGQGRRVKENVVSANCKESELHARDHQEKD